MYFIHFHDVGQAEGEACSSFPKQAGAKAFGSKKNRNEIILMLIFAPADPTSTLRYLPYPDAPAA